MIKHGGNNVGALGVGDVGQAFYLQVESAFVYGTERPRGRAVGQSDFHDKFVVYAMEARRCRRCDMDYRLTAGQKCPGTIQPWSINMRQDSVILKDRNGRARYLLIPGDENRGHVVERAHGGS